MATFVLVTGAWHGAWCWERVAKALRDQGHTVFAPTFTGIGELSHLLTPEVGLETHIDDVEGLVRREDLTGVVLVGHSYGGAVIRGVADRVGERIAALVYLDAFVPEDGQSVHDLLPAEHARGQLEAAEAVGDGWRVPPIPAGVFNVNAADRDWVDAQCTPQPLASFQQKLRLTRPDTAPPSHYIYASGWEATPFTPFYQAAKARGWPTREIACGHDVMLDRPEDLTAALLEIAAR
jgi:pimeloyl-ACP methyl ester carboxylesterase